MTHHRLWVGLVVLMCLGVSACTPDSVETPTPSQPTVVESTPSPTPTAQWTSEEQAAIDTVQAYLDKWNEISQDPTSHSSDELRQYAIDPMASSDIALIDQWRDNGWHLVGTPTYTPKQVNLATTDATQQQYSVYGCYSIGGADIVDQQGISQSGNDRRDLGGIRYTVIIRGDGQFVVDGEDVEDWC